MIQYKAPAKINLFLKVLGKRSDGFHELFMLMDKIPLYDYLSFEKRKGSEIVLKVEGNDISGDNLILKATRLYQEYFQVSGGYHIHLEKNIPIGAGLGGGSSDAATTLLALRDFHGLGTLRELDDIAKELGSDVPFFLRQGACLARGRGIELEQVRGFELENVLLVKPKEGLSTATVYRELREEDYRDSSIEKCLELYRKKDVHFIKESINDLEKPAFRLMPELNEIKEILGPGSLMSGSGSTVFCLCKDRKEAEKKLENLPPELDWWIV